MLRSLFDKHAFLFLVPWVFGFVVFTLGPVLASLCLSLTKFDLLWFPVWVGADNYVRICKGDCRFYQALRVTFTYVLLEVPLKLAFALLISTIRDKAMRGGGLHRTLFFVPSFLGSSDAIAMLWRLSS